VNDLYNENYETLRKEVEEDIRRWKDKGRMVSAWKQGVALKFLH
jgi:hypothetical protein